MRSRRAFRSGRAEAHIQVCDSTNGSGPNRPPRDRGSVAVELVLLTPLVVVLVLFVTFCGRITRAESIVRDAAAAGARAASLRQQPSVATSDAISAVQSSLAEHPSTCPAPAVNVDTSALRPGGVVAVEVRCSTPLRDLVMLGVPGSRSISARSVEVVDTWRGG